MKPAEQFVEYALSIGALELLPEGRKLKSGRISPYFFNSGLFNTGESIFRLANAYVDAMGSVPNVIFGPAYKGIPLAVAVAHTLRGDVGYTFNRKEEKDHGDGGIIVGASLKGKTVLIVDDVMTTGTSSGQAVEIVRANGGIVVECVIAFDRQERGLAGVSSAVQEFEAIYQVPVRAAATLNDLICFFEAAHLEHSEGDAESKQILKKILDYKKEYGIISI